ncbi:MAG: hypothetical protein ABIQ51_13395 [Mesorhizobium sp.]
MADSDNTTSLPRVTRRAALTGTAIAIAEWKRKALARSITKTSRSPEPAVAVWYLWRAAHEETERLCRQQQYMERRLVEIVGVPPATLTLSDGASVKLYTLETLHEVLNAGPKDEATHAKAEAEFAAHQARWDVADQEIGYSATLRAESEASDRMEDILVSLSETPATSLTGVAAKLDAILSGGESSEGTAEFPRLQIRSAFEDIVGLPGRRS